MFRNKSAGIVEHVTSALYRETPNPSDERAWEPRSLASEKPFGLQAIDETYIAAVGFTPTAKRFYRWVQ